MTQPPDHPYRDGAAGAGPDRTQPPDGADRTQPPDGADRTHAACRADRPHAACRADRPEPPDDSAGRPRPPYEPAGAPGADLPAEPARVGSGDRSTRRRRVGVLGGGALLLVAIVAVTAVVLTRPDRSEGARQVASRSVATTSPAPTRTADARSGPPSASPRASHRGTHRSEPPAHRPPAEIRDKVDWSPFEHAYGSATEPAAGSTSAHGGVTQVRASRSFGAYDRAGLAAVTADARYFGSASQARSRYDALCGGGGGKKSGPTRSATVGDRACSYRSDVSDGSSGTVILYVQVLRGNVLLQVTPMAFHDGSWSSTDLATLRSASVRCASATVTRL
ncbi:hypothetical protein Athai_58100 [Actinocatenispora thailandica]|uniref:Uncharacterized protein n=1 Tax=Actinocatenispora thailandica TaxID=227318 RepID=A0A7R7DUX7_9ACTN|nr:hypothetical protein [Actinocatenispora thailandica]BCJ38307.1 hypothetical protein Athai_58100 [Actinocatenispora thailandica]